MESYKLTWEIDMDGKNPKEAAMTAREMQLSTKSMATVFTVVDKDGKKTEVDLGSVKPPKKPLDVQFALFNSHINDAQDRAKDAFIGVFGKEAWEEVIQPKLDKGIMSILQEAPNIRTQFYVYTIWTMVNKY